MRISDWSSDVCSSDDLADVDVQRHVPRRDRADDAGCFTQHVALVVVAVFILDAAILLPFHALEFGDQPVRTAQRAVDLRSEERRVGKERDSTWRSRGSQYH